MPLVTRVLSLGLAFSLATGGVWADSVAVRATVVNVRSAPATTGKIVGSVKEGDVLEVLESRDDWRRVRTRDGVEGWVASRLVEVVTAPAAAPQAPVPQVATPPLPATPTGVGIDHKAVGCIVAEEYPRLEACFAPSETLGRAQIQFRASETSPWYAVDMKPEGPCYSAWLPKPKRETTSIDYFVFAIDTQFAESQRPEKAPSEPYTPRVVRKKSDCDQLKALVAWSTKSAPRILVNLVRDAGGKVLDAAAAAGQAAGTPAGIAGFSNEGVVVANAPASGSSSASGAAAGAAAGGHLPMLAVVGGVALAGGAVALAAGGGGEGSTGSSSSGSGSSTSPQSLSGAWGGSASNGGGWNVHGFVPGGNCTYAYDASATLTQSGNTLSGPLTTTLRSLMCNPSDLGGIIERLVPNFLGSTGGGTLMATLSPPGGITVPLGGGVTLTGTYTATHIRVTGHQATAEISLDYILDLSKR